MASSLFPPRSSHVIAPLLSLWGYKKAAGSVPLSPFRFFDDGLWTFPLDIKRPLCSFGLFDCPSDPPPSILLSYLVMYDPTDGKERARGACRLALTAHHTHIWRRIGEAERRGRETTTCATISKWGEGGRESGKRRDVTALSMLSS